MQSLDEQVGCFTEFEDSNLSGCRTAWGSRKEDSTSVLFYCTKVAETSCSHVRGLPFVCVFPTIHCSMLPSSKLVCSEHRWCQDRWFSALLFWDHVIEDTFEQHWAIKGCTKLDKIAAETHELLAIGVRKDIAATWLLHHDNASSHTSFCVREFLAKHNMQRCRSHPTVPTSLRLTSSYSSRSRTYSKDAILIALRLSKRLWQQF